ncbi:MAG: hypothetical protein ACP5OX_01270 [Minisyncoccia bacterium]
MMLEKKNKENNLLRVYQLAQKDIKGFWKAIIFILVLAVLFAFSSLFLINNFKNFSLGALILSIVFLVLSFSLLTVFVLSTRLNYLFFGLVIFSFAIFTPVFLAKIFFGWLWYLILLSFVLLVLYCLNIRGEAGMLIRLNWGRIIKKGSIFISWLVIILLIFFFYFTFIGEKEAMKNSLGGGLDFLFRKTTKVSGLEGFSFEGTIDELIKSFIQKQTPLGAGKENKALEESLVKEMRGNISKFLGIELKGDEKISQVIINFIFNKWQTLSSSLKWVFYTLIFLVLFSLASLFNFVFSYLLTIFSWILKEVLVSLKVINIENKGIEKEFLSLE